MLRLTTAVLEQRRTIGVVGAAEQEITSELLWSYAPDATQYEHAGVPAWLDELELTPAPPHVKMLTRSLSATG